MKNLILFGAGDFGQRWLNKLGQDKVYAFADCDLNKAGKKIQGKQVLSIEELCGLEDKAIFISTSDIHKRSIETTLIEYGQEKYIVDTPYLEEQNYIDLSAYVNEESFLEGRNVVLKNSQVIDSCLGYASYISSNTVILNTKIGRYSAVGPNVKIIRGQHPSKKFVSIYPGFYSPDNQVARVVFAKENIFEEYRYADYPYSVIIGNDVWIGASVNIMEGITIADGTIIAAGAMVVKDTEPYSIVGGIPAKPIGERFAKEEKDFLIKLKWWEKPEDWLKKYAQYFNNVDELKNILEGI